MAKVKNVYFNDDDIKLLEYCNALPNFSKWVKQKILIEREIGTIETIIKKIIDERMGGDIGMKNSEIANDFRQFM